MPTQTTLSADDKQRVKTAIPQSANKIHYACLGRIYYAYPDPSNWSYAGVQGAVAFVRDNTRNTFFLRVVDLSGTRGVIWEHEFWKGFEYNQDRPFFHSFSGDECMIGIVFADESEAKTFYKKVNKRNKDGVAKASSRKKKPGKGKIDPSWTALLTNLEGHGVDRRAIENDMDFIKKFVRDAQDEHSTRTTARPPPSPAPTSKRKNPPAPRRVAYAHQENKASGSSLAQRAPSPSPRTPPLHPPSHPPPGAQNEQSATDATTFPPVSLADTLPAQFDRVLIDLIGPLPEDEGYTCIVLIMDCLGTDLRIVPTRADITAYEFATIFLDNWYRENGLPLDFVFNHNQLFLRAFWRFLKKLIAPNSELETSISFHAQTDGSSEASVVKSIIQALRSHVTCNPKGWARALPRVRSEIMNPRLIPPPVSLVPFVNHNLDWNS